MLLSIGLVLIGVNIQIAGNYQPVSSLHQQQPIDPDMGHTGQDIIHSCQVSQCHMSQVASNVQE